MNVAAITIPLDRLTVEERLKLLEEIWDSLPDVPMPDWQKRDLDQRHRAFEQDGRTLGLDEVEAAVRDALART